MTIYIALSSVLIITFSVHLFNKTKFVRSVCPVCAGVSVTWLWLLLANILGYNFDWLVIAMMMGGSIVGISYSTEFKNAGLLLKTLFIVSGFFSVYELISQRLATFALGFAFLVVMYLVSNFRFMQEGNRRTEEIKESLKDCCN